MKIWLEKEQQGLLKLFELNSMESNYLLSSQNVWVNEVVCGKV